MMDRKSLLWVASLALPLIGLGISWASTHRMAQTGTDWEVPVMGYDPRDLLRGHYITYRYDWPGLNREGQFGFVNELCIEGKAPLVTRVSIPGMPQVEEAGVPPPKTPVCAITARAPGGGDAQGNGLEGGIYYVPQTQALGLEEKLRDPKLQGVITLRIREDGITRPVGLRFQPRPVPPGAEGSAGRATR